MNSNIYAIMPSAAAEWERAKMEAIARIPRAECSDADKAEITDFIDKNKEYIRQYLGMFHNQRRPLQVVNGVGYIHVNSFVGKNLTFIDRCLGASDYDDIVSDAMEAKSRDDVKCVLMDFDSGGGMALGCVEAGRVVAELSIAKVTYSYVGTICGSAAYAIACGTSGIYGSQSSFAGSIGTIATRFDYERMLEDAGIRAHIVQNEGADLKASGTEFRAPTEAEREHIQSVVDEFGAQFQQWVFSRRPNIPDDGYRGQGLPGRQAVEINFLDGITSREEMVVMLEQLAALAS